jgi:hypothetical protein
MNRRMAELPVRGLKANDNGYLATSQPETFVKLAFCNITQDDSLGYIRNAGYMH